MFDLNEIPEHPPDHFVAAEDLKTRHAGVEKSRLCGHILLPFVQKDADEASTVTLEKPGRSPVELLCSRRSAELLPSRSSLSSSLTVELPQVPKRHSGIDSKAALEEDDVENGDEVGLSSSMLQKKRQQKQPQQKILQETDLCISSHGSAYPFIIGETSTSHTNCVSADASTSHIYEDMLDNCDDDYKTSSLFPLQKIMEPQIVLRNGHGQEEGQVLSPSADRSTISLSLAGSSLNFRAPRSLELSRCSSSSLKRADVFGLALGRSDNHPWLSSRKSSDPSPFWCGKLRTDAPLLTPVDAYCRGIMKPDSQLKKLPAILSSQKFVKLDEFMKNLHNGVTEPLTLFKPSLEASLEEVNRFNLMVKIIKFFEEQIHLDPANTATHAHPEDIHFSHEGMD